MSKEHLSKVVDSIRKGDHDEAQKAFSDYASEKTKEILNTEYNTSEIQDNSEDKTE